MKKVVFICSIFLIAFVLNTNAQVKKEDLGSTNCKKLDKRPGQENTSPCQCTKNGKVYRCDTCDDNAECEEIADLSPNTDLGIFIGDRDVIISGVGGYTIYNPSKDIFIDPKGYNEKTFEIINLKNKSVRDDIILFVESKKSNNTILIAIVLASIIIALGLLLGLKRRM